MLLYDHEIAFDALMLALRWFEDTSRDIDLCLAANVLSKKKNRDYDTVYRELDMAFRSIIRSVVPLAKKRAISEKRRAAVNKRWGKV